MPLNEMEIAALKELIVDPLSEKIDGLIKPMQADVETLGRRMDAAEKTLGRFTRIYTAVVAVGAFTGKYAWGKVRKLF